MLRHRVVATLVFGVVMMTAVPTAALAQSSDPQFRADVQSLLDITGSAKMGAQLASMVADSLMTGLKQSTPDVPDRAFTIIKEVLDAKFVDMYSAPDGVLPDMIDLYAKHFTHDDVLALLTFYRSPVGQKAITLMPVLMQEGGAIGQRWMESQMPEVMQTMQQRLRAEGLIK